MKSYTIVGWIYDADFHCNDCAEKRFPVIRINDSGRVLGGVDNEGNEISPIFVDMCMGDEICGDCFKYIVE